jgi:hypothetical protein
MSRNPILEELYAIREKLLADAGGDLKKYLAGVREREAASGRLLKPASQPTAKTATAAQSDD